MTSQTLGRKQDATLVPVHEEMTIAATDTFPALGTPPDAGAVIEILVNGIWYSTLDPGITLGAGDVVQWDPLIVGFSVEPTDDVVVKHYKQGAGGAGAVVPPGGIPVTI